MTRLAWIAAFAAAAACSKAKGGSSSDGPPSELLDAWKKGSLDPSAFTAATTDVGKTCWSGTVNKVEVLVCSFGSADEAKKAVDAGLKWVGDATGKADARGSQLIAVRDKTKADPSGRTINQIFKLAHK